MVEIVKINYFHAKSLIWPQVFKENLTIAIINDVAKQPNFYNLVVSGPINRLFVEILNVSTSNNYYINNIKEKTMQYFISFLEGIITFVSPCLLPMLPIYISYFAGGDKSDTKKIITNALGFIFGFTLIFVLLGALAGSFGRLLTEYKTAVDIITGFIVMFFGLNFLGVFKLNIFKGINFNKSENTGLLSSVLFGVVFSIGWTPCVGAFLGSALMLAASQGSVIEGVLMLLLYSLGLGIPFFISAILIDKLKSTFTFIKNNYKIINFISGLLLVVVGVLMATGLFGKFLNLLS